MTYHNTFPASPPSVRPRRRRRTNLVPSVRGPAANSACQSEVTIGAPTSRVPTWYVVLTRFWKWRRRMKKAKILPAPSAHDVPRELLLRHAFARFYVDAASRVALASDDLDGARIEVGLDLSCPAVYLSLISSASGCHPAVWFAGSGPGHRALCVKRASSVRAISTWSIRRWPRSEQSRRSDSCVTIVGDRFLPLPQSIWGLCGPDFG